MKTLTSLAIWGRGGGGGSSIIILGPPWFTYMLSFILIYMSNMLSNLIRPILVKIKNMNFSGSCWVLTSNPGVLGAPKYQQMQTSSQWRHTYVQQGKTIENQFLIYGPKCKRKIFWAIWGALGEFNYQTGPILPSSYPLTHIYLHVK